MYSCSGICDGDAAFVICTEKLFTEDLVATNVFVCEAGTWKIVHHQASATATDDFAPEILN